VVDAPRFAYQQSPSTCTLVATKLRHQTCFGHLGSRALDLPPQHRYPSAQVSGTRRRGAALAPHGPGRRSRRWRSAGQAAARRAAGAHVDVRTWTGPKVGNAVVADNVIVWSGVAAVPNGTQNPSETESPVERWWIYWPLFTPGGVTTVSLMGRFQRRIDNCIQGDRRAVIRGDRIYAASTDNLNDAPSANGVMRTPAHWQGSRPPQRAGSDRVRSVGVGLLNRFARHHPNR